MAFHTFVIDGRKRLQISQSKTEPGKVLVQILDSARDVLASCSMDASTAAVISQAFDVEAIAAEKSATCERPCQLMDEGGEGCLRACLEDVRLRSWGGCNCAASKQEKFKPPCTCHEGRLSFFRGGPVLSALPVVDVAQVGA